MVLLFSFLRQSPLASRLCTSIVSVSIPALLYFEWGGYAIFSSATFACGAAVVSIIELMLHAGNFV